MTNDINLWGVPGDKLLVRRDAAAKEKGGFVVPDRAQRQQSQGTVLTVGPLVKQIQAGYIVRFGSFSGQEAFDDDERHVLLREEEILVFRENDADAAVPDPLVS